MTAADCSISSLVQGRSSNGDAPVDIRVGDILRKRRRPLLLLLDDVGDLLYSTLDDGAPPADHRLVGQAVAEVKALFASDSLAFDDRDLYGSPAPNLRWSLVVVDNTVYCVRLFAMHRAADGLPADQFAALIEPIVGHQQDRIDFATIKARFRLSNRELDVLSALMTGTKDKQIARDLGVSVGTVRAYLKSVRVKLGVTTRTAAVNLVHETSGKGGSQRNSTET